MKRPEDVQLSREEGEALLARLEANTLTAEDRRVLGKVLTFYFWLLFALREAKLSLKRVKALVFGEKPKKPKPPSSGGTPSGGSAGESEAQTRASQGGPASAPTSPPEKKLPPPGHGRYGADVYRAAQTVACRHEELAVGQRCPACGRGRLYRLPPGVEMRLDGAALLAAVRYEVEKFRCSACGQIFPAPLPIAAGSEKYTARARAVLALARYYLGVPLYRVESYQALVGVPLQSAERAVEPNSSLGKAITYMVGHWKTLTRFLTVPEAPLDNNTAERALKLCIRQRKNSLFYATEHSAYIASLLTSLIATCVQAGVNALEYLAAGDMGVESGRGRCALRLGAV